MFEFKLVYDGVWFRFWVEYGEVFEKISREQDVRAVVLASSLPKVFSAGLDCMSSPTSSSHRHINMTLHLVSGYSFCVERIPNIR